MCMIFRCRGLSPAPAKATQLKNLRMTPSTRKTLVSVKFGTSSQIRCGCSADGRQYCISREVQCRHRTDHRGTALRAQSRVAGTSLDRCLCGSVMQWGWEPKCTWGFHCSEGICTWSGLSMPSACSLRLKKARCEKYACSSCCVRKRRHSSFRRACIRGSESFLESIQIGNKVWTVQQAELPASENAVSPASGAPAFGRCNPHSRYSRSATG